MNLAEELVERCSLKRREQIGPLSDQAFEELVLSVRQNPQAFIDEPAEQALSVLQRALDAFRGSMRDSDLLDDDQYMAQRKKSYAALRQGCLDAIKLDGDCVDAQLVLAQASYGNPDELLDKLSAVEETIFPDGASFGPDAWDDVFARPQLRLYAAMSRACEDGARYRMALNYAELVMSATEKRADPLGARFTAALALCRLEDEEGLNRLDERFSLLGNAWMNLARCILLYKLDRMPAARRALRGYANLSEGGAYALLRPIFVETYLPDRPDYAPGSFEEALCVIHEAEPIIADTPDFIAWCQTQDWLVADAQAFAEKRDLDW